MCVYSSCMEGFNGGGKEREMFDNIGLETLAAKC